MRNRLRTTALSLFILTAATSGGAQAAEPPHGGPVPSYISVILDELSELSHAFQALLSK